MPADPGLMWMHALSGVGNNIADAMQQYHKEHVAYDQQEQIAMALSRLGIDEATGKITPITEGEGGKGKSKIQPIIDPKALEMFTTKNATKRAAASGAMEALNRIGMHTIGQVAGPIQAAKLQQERAQAALYQKAVDDPIGRLGSGETIVNTPHGVSVQGGRGAATVTAEAGRAARFQATQALKARKDLLGQFTAQFGQYGIQHPSEFLGENIQAGTYDEKTKKFAPVTDGKNAPYARIGDDGSPIPMQALMQGRRLANEYQKLGQIGYGGLTGGQQTEAVKVTTPEEARKLAPGTIYETPNGDQYQVPPK